MMKIKGGIMRAAFDFSEFLLNAIFPKKIKFNDNMNQFVDLVKNINWFYNCGEEYKENLYYSYCLEEKINAQKTLSRTRNYQGCTTLENLLIEAGRRLGVYLDNHYPKEAQYKWNNLADKIDKTSAVLNLKKIDDDFNKKFNLQNKRYISRIFKGALMELYFQDYIPDTPLFYAKIFKIYEDGHIITGWSGKFQSHELGQTIETAIDKNEGKLIVY